MSYEIITGDCLDWMREREAGSVDAVVTDPPYGISDAVLRLGPSGPMRGGNRTTGGDNTYHPVTDWDGEINPEWCSAACGVAPVVAWFGHWRLRTEVEAAMPYKIRAEIIWNKDTHCGPPCPVARKDERIWLFSEKGIKPARFDVSVWDIPVIPTWSHKWHKNEKPLAIMKRLIELLTHEGDTVLDPFCGSGTTGVACIETGRNFVGIEINPEYADIARARCEKAERQPDMFVKAPKPQQLGLAETAPASTTKPTGRVR